MRMGNWFGMGLCVAMLVAGCGSDSDSPSPAVRQCSDLEENWCEHAVGCLVNVGTLSESERGPNMDACLDAIKEGLDCRKAVSTTSAYPQCMSDVETMDCARWNVPLEQLENLSLPDSCKGVILVSQ